MFVALCRSILTCSASAKGLDSRLVGDGSEVYSAGMIPALVERIMVGGGLCFLLRLISQVRE